MFLPVILAWVWIKDFCSEILILLLLLQVTVNPPKRPPDAILSDVTTADQVKSYMLKV